MSDKTIYYSKTESERMYEEMNSKNTGLYMIACVEGRVIYAHHDKVYYSIGMAKNALNTMKKNGKMQGDEWKIMSIVDLREVE